ncbi:MAG: hypothetical protein FIA92_09545 [Chloroflexi bacterium]|nr:hypothetical protein [Chloroflexota bacterium]
MAENQEGRGEVEAVMLESAVDGRTGVPDGGTTPGSGEGTNDNQGGVWPVSDRVEAPVHQDDTPPAPVAAPRATARRENPLVAGLVKAMREAAQASRAESIEALRSESTAQVEAIRAGATDGAEGLRKQADDDIAGIREWAKAEIARIRQESEQRIVDRRDSLEGELEAHAGAVDAQVAEVETAVADYESEMEEFFERLLAEEDPAKLAALAERAPEPPILSELPAVQRTRLATQLPPEPAPETAPPTDVADDGPDAPTAEALGQEAAAAAEAEAFEALGLPDQDADAPATDGAEAHDPESGEGDVVSSGTARLIVRGLTTVAGISAFKGALGQVAGVRAVSVMAGEPGTFVFTITHDSSADLRTALPQLDGFDAEITSDDGDSMQVTAREPAA